MVISPHHVWSDFPVSPGRVLKEEIEHRGILGRTSPPSWANLHGLLTR